MRKFGGKMKKGQFLYIGNFLFHTCFSRILANIQYCGIYWIEWKKMSSCANLGNCQSELIS